MVASGQAFSGSERAAPVGRVAHGWAALEAASGIVFAALVIVQTAILGTGPAPNDSAQKIVQYFSDHREAFLIGAYLNALAAFAFFWFLNALRGALQRAEGGEGSCSRLAFVGGLIAVPLVLGSYGAQAAIAYHIARDANPDLAVARGLFDLGFVGFYAACIPLALFLTASGLVVTRAGGLPRWLGWAALVLAAANLVAAAGVVNDTPWLALVAFGSFMLMVVWALVVSVVLTRRAWAGGA